MDGRAGARVGEAAPRAVRSRDPVVPSARGARAPGRRRATAWDGV